MQHNHTKNLLGATHTHTIAKVTTQHHGTSKSDLATASAALPAAPSAPRPHAPPTTTNRGKSPLFPCTQSVSQSVFSLLYFLSFSLIYHYLTYIHILKLFFIGNYIERSDPPVKQGCSIGAIQVNPGPIKLIRRLQWQRRKIYQLLHTAIPLVGRRGDHQRHQRFHHKCKQEAQYQF